MCLWIEKIHVKVGKITLKMTQTVIQISGEWNMNVKWMWHQKVKQVSILYASKECLSQMSIMSSLIENTQTKFEKITLKVKLKLNISLVVYVDKIWKLSECDIKRLANFQFYMCQKRVLQIKWLYHVISNKYTKPSLQRPHWESNFKLYKSSYTNLWLCMWVKYES